jgi:hypothetical protein
VNVASNHNDMGVKRRRFLFEECCQCFLIWAHIMRGLIQDRISNRRMMQGEEDKLRLLGKMIELICEPFLLMAAAWQSKIFRVPV